MSVVSAQTKNSRISSILKKAPSLRSRLSLPTPTKVRFLLPHSKRIRNIILDYVRNKNSKEYENLVCSIRDSDLLDEDIRSLLSEATQCISLLNQDLRLFVESILLLKWVNRSEDAVSEYQSFLINLLSAHNYHAKFAIDSLVACFVPGSEEPEWLNGIPADVDCKLCVNVHFIFNVLIKVVPMCKDLLLQSLRSNYPYLKKSTHMHEYYLHNLLWILDYMPQFRSDILHLIISKLVLLDVNAPKEDIEYAENVNEDAFSMEDDLRDRSNINMKHPVAHTLDVCMEKLFNYCILECHDVSTGELNWAKTKNLYQDFIQIFDEVLLPTYNTHHVQFIMFNLCCFKVTITEAFLNYLWKKVCTPNVASVHRQTAVAYIASLVARGSFVPLSILKGTLQQMAGWIHVYISSQDGLECVNSDVRVHTVFYSICQALFYIVAFRHRYLVNTRKNIAFLETLNLTKIVTCRLNPLRICQPEVVANFAAVTRTYQLAYCYSVMEHNARNNLTTIYQDERGSVITSTNLLDSFFPFDPYLLKRSRHKITPFYLEYQDNIEIQNVHKIKDSEVDDFLTEQSEESRSSTNKFSYGSSPGFKHKANNK